jgi:hypothetical protein
VRLLDHEIEDERARRKRRGKRKRRCRLEEEEPRESGGIRSRRKKGKPELGSGQSLVESEASEVVAIVGRLVVSLGSKQRVLLSLQRPIEDGRRQSYCYRPRIPALGRKVEQDPPPR